MWCSYAHKASHILVVCRTAKADSPHDGMSMVLVPRDADGLTITPISTLGGKETNELHLEDCRVPEDALLGAEGNGWTQLMAGLNNERVILGASALGLGQRAFDDALACQGAAAVRTPDRSLPGDPAQVRGARHRARAGAAARALGGADDG